MNSGTCHIIEKFPDQKYTIDQLMVQDPEFLSLCEDYDACINAIQYWSQSDKPEADIMIDEFRNIADELEEEVVEALISMRIR